MHSLPPSRCEPMVQHFLIQGMQKPIARCYRPIRPLGSPTRPQEVFPSHQRLTLFLDPIYLRLQPRRPPRRRRTPPRPRWPPPAGAGSRDSSAQFAARSTAGDSPAPQLATSSTSSFSSHRPSLCTSTPRVTRSLTTLTINSGLPSVRR